MATLTAEDRKELPKSKFGVPSDKRFPMPDANHARNALARLSQAKGLSDDEKREIIKKANKILAREKK